MLLLALLEAIPNRYMPLLRSLDFMVTCEL